MDRLRINRDFNLARLKNMPKILEARRRNVHNDFNQLRESIINEFQAPQNEFVEYVLKANYYANPFLNEAEEFVPRYSLKKYSHPIFSQFEPNKEYPFSQDLISKAIEYGMALLIQYKGEKDDFSMGHSRVIYPMVLGRSKAGKLLLRGWHLKGWSVSQRGNTEKDWRLFRCDRILSMSFSGTFFRLPPEGYRSDDKGMVGGIIKSANFDQIRRNQLTLVQKQVIQRKKDIDIDQGPGKPLPVIQIEETDSILDLRKPFDNVNLDEKNKSLIRLTFLKSNFKNEKIAVLGAYGKKGNQVRVVKQGGVVGTFTVMRSILGHHLGKAFYNNIDGTSEFDLYIFIKIVNASDPQPQNMSPKEKPSEEESKDETSEEPKDDGVYRPGTGKEKDIYKSGDVIEWDLNKDKPTGDKPDNKPDNNKPNTNSETDDIYSPD